jgi:hypothetical protein
VLQELTKAYELQEMVRNRKMGVKIGHVEMIRGRQGERR